MNNYKYDIINDELKRLTNRCIGKLLDSLGDTVNSLQIKEIKSQIRMLEYNIRDNILTAGQSNDSIKK